MKPVTTLPNIEITLNEEMLLPSVLEQLNAVTVIQKVSKPSVCELEFSGNDGPVSASGILVPGSNLTLNIIGEVSPLFTGTLTAAEYTYEPDGIVKTTVRGYDPLYPLCRSQHITTYTRTSLSDLFREMTDIPVQSNIDDTVWERLVQFNETDMDFLSRISHQSGCYFFLREDNIHLFDLRPESAQMTLTSGKNLLECSIEINSSHSLKSVYCNGWDPFTGELYESTSSDSDSGCNTDFTFCGTASDQSPDKILVDLPIRNSDEAETVARSEMGMSKSAELTLKGVADGTTDLYPGASVFVDNISHEFVGVYTLTEVTHIINSRYGYVSKISTSPALSVPHTPYATTTFGTVTDINDPENAGRIKVALEAYNNIETDWMHTVLPSSGKEKGLVMLPDTDDRVLVLFMNNNPARGIVIGGVSTEQGSSHQWGIENGEVRNFSFISPAGQKLILDDKNKLVKLENRDGSTVELGPETLTIHSKTDLVIEAPGKTITIRGSNIDFKKG